MLVLSLFVVTQFSIIILSLLRFYFFFGWKAMMKEHDALFNKITQLPKSIESLYI